MWSVTLRYDVVMHPLSSLGLLISKIIYVFTTNDLPMNIFCFHTQNVISFFVSYA